MRKALQLPIEQLHHIGFSIRLVKRQFVHRTSYYRISNTLLLNGGYRNVNSDRERSPLSSLKHSGSHQNLGQMRKGKRPFPHDDGLGWTIEFAPIVVHRFTKHLNVSFVHTILAKLGTKRITDCLSCIQRKSGSPLLDLLGINFMLGFDYLDR